MTFRKIIRSLTVFLFATAPVTLAQNNPVPLVNNPLVPTSAAPGSAGFTLIVNGTGFVSGSIVDWNGIALPSTFVNGSQLAASVPASDIAAPGTASVRVVNPLPGGGTSNVGYFTIRQPFSAVAFGSGSVNTPSAPQWTATGDFNGDGILDLVSSEVTAMEISVFLGKGDGSFQSATSYPAGYDVSEGTVGDFNGDGKLDVAVLNLAPGVSIFLGNGDGTFQPLANIAVNGSPLSITEGDFNKDGILDLAVGLEFGQVAVFLGTGNGSFQTEQDYSAGSGYSISIATGDFNLDGTLDLVVSMSRDNAVAILLGNGDGTFQTSTEFTTAAEPYSVAVADLNGDGTLDLAVSADNSIPPEVSVLLGNGDGTFQPHLNYPTIGYSLGVAAADFNGDGKLDLAVSSDLSASSVLLGNGDGTFQAPSRFPAGYSPFNVAIGDFNNDGRLDLAVPDLGDTTISVLSQVTAVPSRTNINFGKVKVGTGSKTFNLILSNIGTTSFAVKRIAIAGAEAGQFSEKNNCVTVMPGGSCPISVVFKPTSSGSFNALLEIQDTAVNNLQFVTLIGSGD